MQGKSKKPCEVLENFASLTVFGNLTFAIVVLVLLSACATPTATSSPSPTLVPTALTPTSSPTATTTQAAVAVPTTRARATQTPALAPTIRLGSAITEIAKGFGAPDDVALLPDGSIVFSDLANVSVNEIRLNGEMVTLLRGLDEPEGIAVLPDGSLIIAEQGKNRLLLWNRNSRAPEVWLQLENRTGQAGVDGIARDPSTGDIIVPDPPNGRVLRVSPTKNVQVIAMGMVRPTGAAVASDGSIYIADEFGDSVKQIRNGSVKALGRFPMPDDVAVDAHGNVYVACLGDNSIRMLDARTGTTRLIASVRSPQGLVIDTAGNLIVVESATNRIVSVRLGG